MNNEKNNLVLAIVLSVIAIGLTNFLFPAQKKETPQVQTAPQMQKITDAELLYVAPALEAEDVLAQDKRLQLSNDKLSGSIRLKGARLDELNLTKYKESLDADSKDVELFFPSKTKSPYFAEFGWLSTDKSITLPTKDSLWTVRGNQKLTPSTPVVLEYSNNQGLKFIQKISLDDDYMFFVEQLVENKSGKVVELYPFALISKKQEEAKKTSVVHEGFIGVLADDLKEVKFSKLEDKEAKTYKSSQGWLGFSDKYWFSSVIFKDSKDANVKFSNIATDTYQADYVGAPVVIQPSSIGVNNLKLFAGAKEIKLLDKYTDEYNIGKFDLAVDFGWYYFLTKPFFYVLDFLYKLIGNMGWSILLFAALLRLAMFPVANKSFDSMSKMKKVQPRLKELQDRYSNDKMRLQQEMMALYKKEKINPASGCLPMFIQIPVFFSLYKVLNISIEIRHAPFIGWIKDLSAPDPMTISHMTGLPIPTLLNIGILPIVMGITMWLQQKLNPAPTNKDQARAFALMPLIFTFMMGHFASGLVIYWTLSNILSMTQQKVIMKKNGVK
ncbi:MAG: membrane protein insertase YidC [Alphaproteobacteria bacterium]